MAEMTLEDWIAADMQRKIGDDVTRAAYRVLALMPQEHYFTLLLQATSAMVQMTAQLVEQEAGRASGEHPDDASMFMVALMAVRCHIARRPVHFDEMMAQAQRDMQKIGVRFEF